ncbi:TBC1 domain family member 23 [Centruroides vittatus]|uniref:TBC1 domain family member 23 n=1 Tax=Centruroides vittatus TaxID=120091 RepID=UPI00350E9744
MDETSWILELESCLLSECDINTIRRICNGRPLPDHLRRNVWEVCLRVRQRSSDYVTWDEIYDLTEQSIIRQDCQELVDRLGNEEEDKISVMSDLESVITKYCKVTGETYETGNRWLQLLEPLIALHLPKAELYSWFCAIRRMYLVRRSASAPFHFFRLLLLYHDPELCSLLDTKKISVESFAESWFNSLFSSTCHLNVTMAIWDVYFQTADPFLIFYLALVLVVNSKEQAVACKEKDKQAIVEILSSAPYALEFEDVEDFCLLAQHYASRTPPSFARDHHGMIFGEGDEGVDFISQALCLPVSIYELVLSSESERNGGVRYFVVDCRPAEQYNAGHLPTAFHLDASTMLQEPAAFHTAVQALYAAQRQAIQARSVAGGEHVCFMGSGREEEDQYVHMVVASFLQKQLSLISLVKGGYAALHDFFVDNLNEKLMDHNPKLCIMCNPSPGNDSGIEEEEISFLDKLTSAVKTRSAVVKYKLVEYIKNPQDPVEKHVSSTDKVGKRYRGMAPIFSIDDEHEEGRVTDEELLEEIHVEKWLKASNIADFFKCEELQDNGSINPAGLAVLDTELILIREIPNKKGYAYIVAKRPLLSIVKITSKRRHPELITFKYGYNTSKEDYVVTAMDRLLIPKAGDATKLIKYKVISLMNL